MYSQKATYLSGDMAGLKLKECFSELSLMDYLINYLYHQQLTLRLDILS